jgi:hypothetical protein
MPAQNTDIFNIDSDGLDFSADTETLTISAGVVVSSVEANGVESVFNDSTLDNFGQVFCRAQFPFFMGLGIAFYGDNGTVINEAGAGIISNTLGVLADGNHEAIENLGSIVGLRSGVVFGRFSNNTQLINHGSIYGHFAGVVPASMNEGGTVINDGVIRSDKLGVEVDNIGFTTSITNTAKGIIEGATDAVKTVLGAMSLDNLGTLIGNVDCTVPGANDAIINHGNIVGQVLLDSGNDVFNGRGGTSGDIFAGAGNDLIMAGKGKVAVHVGTGNSTLTAGRGHDQFIFDSGLASQVDTITNFKHGRDKIVLSETDFLGIGPINHRLAGADFHIGTHATTASQHIIYNPTTGFLFYDPDGSGPMPQIHFATVAAHLQHNDLFVIA